ncbi:hypothetical protein DFP92_11586 [Yoonia sediminilitoris]|uniref:Uncharacterized protein n=1 Tax=Yoonia sediminilitoris TaxID=1286148 RepID=A0A2T6K8R8_9RHOB|nr:hypothetical protein C8N45_11586 [Yoonia sediminilitoris]RCW91021.1 hypothetical protein DFP92_11586 [Yoonia sediminilitoris]
MTGEWRSADAQDKIFETLNMNGCFSKERTVAKNASMSESRDKMSFYCVCANVS